MTTSTLVTFVVIAIAVIWAISVYNQLVALANQYKNAFAQIDVQLKRRHDLVPNLVETAKGYLKHERETLEAVIAARNTAAAALNAMNRDNLRAESLQTLGNAESALGSAVSRLNLVMEAYPDLKASANMQQLSEELASTENRVAFARQGFNDAVMRYNITRQRFPNVLIAGWFGHRADAGLLEFDDSEHLQRAPAVSFQ